MKRFRKSFRYGEKGFTLIELLVVIAILGVLAAVIVPNVSRFMGSGKREAATTELHNVQTAMIAMMVDHSPTLTAVTTVTPANATSDMTGFPDGTHPLYSGNTSGNRYLQNSPTEYYYSTDNTGAVQGWYSDGGEIGVADPP